MDSPVRTGLEADRVAESLLPQGGSRPFTSQSSRFPIFYRSVMVPVIRDNVAKHGGWAVDDL